MKNREALKAFLAKKGIAFKDLSLYERAFTHSSYANENRHLGLKDNERLEFLGDSALALTAAHFLYTIKPERSEGDMTKIRAGLVREEALATYMRNLEMPRFLHFGRGEEASGGRERNALLADAFEAFLGAIYLDLGFEAVYQFLSPILEREYKSGPSMKTTDFKSILQELVQADSRKAIAYDITKEDGPAHDRHFSAVVMLDGIVLGEGYGKSKKDAHQMAAKAAIEILATAKER